MINFTDMTGLASSVVAITAMVVQLPVVKRLQRIYFTLLVCAIVIMVVFPFGGLPPAVYVRGWIGDLSITSLVLLALTIINVKLAQRDFVPLARSRDNQRLGCGLWQLSRMASCFIQRAGEREAGMADVTIGGADMPVRTVCGCPAKAKTALLILIAFAALGLYPMALGISFFDPYRLGYGNPWFMGGLLLLALAACFRRLPVITPAIALAVFAWGVGWYESTNLWDYLLDPLLAIYAISALVRHGIQILLKSRRG